MKRMLSLLISLLLAALPLAAVGETVSTELPYGMVFGLNTAEVEAVYRSDAVLSKLTMDQERYDDGVTTIIFDDAPIPGTQLVAGSLSLQVDENNSPKTPRLSMMTFLMSPVEDSIAAFRAALAALTAAYGAPQSDPFSAEAVETYVEWGNLSALWELGDARISLSLSRMYQESLAISYMSCYNYLASDLQ